MRPRLAERNAIQKAQQCRYRFVFLSPLDLSFLSFLPRFFQYALCLCCCEHSALQNRWPARSILKKSRHCVFAQAAKSRGARNCRLRIEYSSGRIPYLILLCISSGFGKTIPRNEFSSSQMTIRPSTIGESGQPPPPEAICSIRLSDSALSFQSGSD